jgi:hypothetical protein
VRLELAGLQGVSGVYVAPLLGQEDQARCAEGGAQLGLLPAVLEPLVVGLGPTV